ASPALRPPKTASLYLPGPTSPRKKGPVDSFVGCSSCVVTPGSPTHATKNKVSADKLKQMPLFIGVDPSTCDTSLPHPSCVEREHKAQSARLLPLDGLTISSGHAPGSQTSRAAGSARFADRARRTPAG